MAIHAVVMPPLHVVVAAAEARDYTPFTMVTSLLLDASLRIPRVQCVDFRYTGEHARIDDQGRRLENGVVPIG